MSNQSLRSADYSNVFLSVQCSDGDYNSVYSLHVDTETHNIIYIANSQAIIQRDS